ncbi:tripartite tricarboxylate transporter TctB family protein [Bosea psychrotolerans]|uniref:Tripartite tricarboxylate transporter TctB family protein n=1 Tax=Bosea psychrotolerans TaxID=1871628 RepID=A0A2S4M0Y3_9HYPH|nr:tripartite tricarboxylate transporter TctB family protein [Bosea psychrotolerans]POR48328.1 tripartite tricarboxylate transporter TctB family protein [Bosea psychrotolerans]
MKVKFAGNQDAIAGLIFIALGTIGFVIALKYSFGNSVEMGPGYFPRVLSILLIGFGLLTLVRGLRDGVAMEGIWAWLPLLFITLSIMLFGAAIERLGLAPAVMLLIAASAYAGHEFRLREVAVLAVVMAVFATAVFVWGLRLPYPLFAWNL